MLTTAICSFIRGRGPILAYLLLSLVALLFPPAAAVLVNVTVDDTFGSSDRSVVPTYSPNNDSWHLGSPTEQCSVCTLKPSEFDTGQIYDQSWHHATYFNGIPVQVSVTFHGTALYVYNVIPNTLKGANTYVDLSFSIDGATVGSFTHSPDSSSTILYNHLVYSNTQLSDSVHTFVMSASGRRSSLIFFDYLVYTTNIDVPAPVGPTNMAPSQGSAPSSPSANSPPPASVASTSSSTGSSSSPDGNTTSSSSSPSSPSSPSSSSPSAASGHSNAASEATGSGSSFTTTLTVSSSSTAAATIAAPSTHSNTAAIAGGVAGGILLLLAVPTLLFCRQRRRRAAASIVDPYNFALPDSALTYSSPATAIAPSPTALGSPTATSFSARREWELKGRMEALQMQQHQLQQEPLMAAHDVDSDLPTHTHHPRPRPRRETRTFSDTTGSTAASASGMSVGAVQALQEEIAALRGVLSGLAVYGRGHQGHAATRESEILPEYEEARRAAPFVST